MLTITPMHDDSRDCFEDLVASVTLWWGRNYELMFAEAWDFPFKYENIIPSDKLGEKLDFIDYDRKWDLLEEYHGIKLTFHYTESADEVINIIKRELDGNRPVSIYIDAFWCPWHSYAYKKVSSPHFCLAIELNGKNIHCVDGNPLNYGAILPYEDLSNGCKGCVTFSLKDNYQNNIHINDIIEGFPQKIINLIEQNKVFHAIRSFGNFANDLLNLEMEVKGYENFGQSPIFTKLSSIANGRLQYAKALKYISNITSIKDFLFISERIERAGMRWVTINAMLMKAHVMQNFSIFRSRIVNKIYEAADDEEDIYKLLQRIVSNNTILQFKSNHYETLSAEEEMTIPDKMVFVNLSDYFNNQGFGSSLSLECKADIDGVGHYFLTEGLPTDNSWQIKNMRFDFHNPMEGKSDNISCSGQIIYIPSGRYSTIMILGCAEWGHFCESIVTKHEDESTELIPLCFSDWGSSIPKFGEIIAWSGNGAERKESNIICLANPLHIYAQKYALKCDNDIVSIQLPDCPNIHIFAITLH